MRSGCIWLHHLDFEDDDDEDEDDWREDTEGPTE